MAVVSYKLVAAVVLLAFFCTTVSAISCWRCSTDVSNGQFCNDPFDPDTITDQQRYWSYVNCSYPSSVKTPNTRSSCKKLVQEVYGKEVIIRSCFYDEYGDPMDKCASDTTTSYSQTKYCQICSTDGCNSATGFMPFAAISMLLPALVFTLPHLLGSSRRGQ